MGPQGFHAYPNRYFVETRAYLGNGIRMALDAGFAEIHSLENSKHSVQHCREHFDKNPNVHLWHKNSRNQLFEVIQSIREPITFWLNGHNTVPSSDGSKNTSLIEELEQIKKHPIKTHTLLIDDMHYCNTLLFDFLTVRDIIKKVLEINPNYIIDFVPGGDEGEYPFNVLVARPSIQQNRVKEFPETIDFGAMRIFQDLYNEEIPNTWLWNLADSALKAGISAFNDSPEIGTFICFLKEKYQIDGVVETGTFFGFTTSFFARHFNEVHTIEIIDQKYENAKDLFQGYNHVHCHQGNSPEVLNKILPSMKDKRLLFYLDAHWESYWPLLDELHEITQTHKDNCIIVVDDFKVPGRYEIRHDAYGEDECSHEYIKNSLKKLFSDYSFHYLIPKDFNRRAKFVAVPKNWSSKEN